MQAATAFSLTSLPISAIAPVVLIILYIVTRLTRNYLRLSSLNLPGPLLARITSKWLIYNFMRGDHMNSVHAAHLKYGPMVQTGPQDLSFSTAQALKDIYGLYTPCIKGRGYEYLGPPSLITFRDKDRHRERRRRVLPAFAPSSINEYVPVIHDLATTFNSLIERSGGKPWDVIQPTRLFALDAACMLLVGEKIGALGAKETPRYVQLMNYVHPMFTLRSEVPILAKILELLPGKWARDFTESVDYIYGYGEQRIASAIAKNGRQSTRHDLLSRLLNSDPKTGHMPLADKEVADEMFNSIFAGTDTTALSISYLLYELASHPEWQDKLRQEIAESGVKNTAKDAEGNNWDYGAIQGLQVLQACMHESMRIHPGAGIGLLRVTPAEGCRIDGIFVPGNTNVSVPMLDIQRTPRIFPDPDTFNPSRWLVKVSDEKRIKFSRSPEQAAHMFLWGGGEGVCVGQPLATMEIKICVSRVVAQWNIGVVEPEKGKKGETHRDMRMGDHLIVEPKGGRGRLIFTKV